VFGRRVPTRACNEHLLITSVSLMPLTITYATCWSCADILSSQCCYGTPTTMAVVYHGLPGVTKVVQYRRRCILVHVLAGYTDIRKKGEKEGIRQVGSPTPVRSGYSPWWGAMPYLAARSNATPCCAWGHTQTFDVLRVYVTSTSRQF